MIQGIAILFIVIWLLVISPSARLAFVILCGLIGILVFATGMSIPEVRAISAAVGFIICVVGIFILAIVRAERWPDPPEPDEPPYLRDDVRS